MDQVDNLIREVFENIADEDVIVLAVVVPLHERLELFGEVHALGPVDLLEVLYGPCQQLLQ